MRSGFRVVDRAVAYARLLRRCKIFAAVAAAAGLAACGGGSDSGAAPVTATASSLMVVVPSLTPQYTFTVIPDVIYGQGEVAGGAFADLLLDLYLPDELTPAAEKRFPLMLMLHGGGFVGGSKADPAVVSAAEEYARRGWLVAVVNYRLQVDDPVPSARVQSMYAALGGAAAPFIHKSVVTGVDDVLAALDYLESREDVYMPWATLWGYSAGAVLALATGYGLDDFGMEAAGVSAVVEIAGAVNTIYDGTPFDHPTTGDPVLMMIHGQLDRALPHDLATSLAAQAAAAGLPHEFQSVPGVGHNFSLFTTPASTGASLYQRTVDYLHETLFSGHNSGPLTIQ